VHPVSSAPPDHVARAFGASSEPIRIAAGQGTSWRAGDLVLKPVDDEEEVQWRCRLLDDIDEHGFRVSRPVRDEDGSFVVDGWTASHWVDGEPDPRGRWTELFEAAEAFLVAVRAYGPPSFLVRRRHWWAQADRAAWGEQDLPGPPVVRAIADRLAALSGPVRGPAQLVHGDLAGNVLFQPGKPPAVIDLSPYWRPTAYAIGIAVADGLLSYGEGPGLLAVAGGRTSIAFVARGALFRLLVLQQSCEARGVLPVAGELARYEQVTTVLEQRRR
jgi:uncharacterized protein (TIGR02569 family)